MPGAWTTQDLSNSFLQARAAARKEAERLSGRADKELRVSKDLQTDMQALREKIPTMCTETKAMEKRHKKETAEMEASELPLVQVMLQNLTTDSPCAATEEF